VPAERVDVTPYGVAARFSRQAAPRPKVADSPLLLFPGAPSRRKNLELVLEALAGAADGGPLARARLAISGAGAQDFPNHKRRIQQMGLTSRVEWRGKVPVDDMPQLIADSDLVVYPSLYEGFGFPALEAMAAGTPVVASNASCLPEVLGDGALLVDPTDVRAFKTAAETLLTNADVRCALVDKGKARASQFTWRRCADLTAEVYRQALAGPPKPQ
jgi:glycosyltransferase involved in cell wall biosynthesis